MKSVVAMVSARETVEGIIAPGTRKGVCRFTSPAVLLSVISHNECSRFTDSRELQWEMHARCFRVH
jgi:hypothetical protein